MLPGLMPLVAAGKYTIANSLIFNDGDGAYLSRTPAGAGNQKTWTFSAWIKRGNLGTVQNIFGTGTLSATTPDFNLYINNNDTLQVYRNSSTLRSTVRKISDPSAWYHIVLAIDSTDATPADRIKLYINGVQETEFTGTVDLTLNADYPVNSAIVHSIGRPGTQANYYFDGYIAEVVFVDGQALDPYDFGEFSTVNPNVWLPRKYTGTFGTNGFYLKFGNSGALGTDSSPAGNNWTPNSIGSTDQSVDTPTNNYCTWNFLDQVGGGGLSEGNKTFNENAAQDAVRATIPVFSGKWYFEALYTASGTSDGSALVGIQLSDQPVDASNSIASVAAGTFVFRDDGRIIENGAATAGFTNYGSTDVVMVAIDLDNDLLWFGINGVWEAGGNPVAGTGEQFSLASYSGRVFAPYCGFQASAGTQSLAGRFIEGEFTYTPPAGFKALSANNLPHPDVVNGQNYAQVKLRVGTSAVAQITDIGWQPDLVWTKGRNSGTNHRLFDSERGWGAANKELATNSTGEEGVNISAVGAFLANGYEFTATGSGTWEPNFTGTTYVDWLFKKLAGAFDIQTYTGDGLSSRTVLHDLGVVPEMIIVKRIDTGGYDWNVYHSDVSPTNYLRLNTTNLQAAATNIWDAAAGASNFTVGSSAQVNASGGEYVAYLFASLSGLIKVGSYIGDGLNNGPFIYTGGIPLIMMIKRVDQAYNWTIWDRNRDLINPAERELYPNVSTAETDANRPQDFVSNGFKIRDNNVTWNASGGIYVYLAIMDGAFGGINVPPMTAH